MIDLLAVYICPQCGEVLEDQVQSVEIIDTDRDDVWTEKVHTCGHSVQPKVVEENGQKITCFQKVDHERWLWATGYYDDFDDEGEGHDSSEDDDFYLENTCDCGLYAGTSAPPAVIQCAMPVSRWVAGFATTMRGDDERRFYSA